MKTKSIKNILRIGALAGFMAFMSCERDYAPEIDHQSTYLSNIHETEVAGNLERPSGLSSNYSSDIYSLKKLGIKSFQEENLSVLAQGPIFYHNREIGKIDKAKSKNPKISQLSGDLNNLSLNSEPLTEFSLGEYFLDFNTPSSHGIDSIRGRPIGLTLDNLVMSDGTILLSSNSSNKIFRINPVGIISIYLEDTELERITDILKASDEKIYAVQAPFIHPIDSSLLVPKKVISIDNKEIKEEFTLPSENSCRIGYNANFYEQLKIAENSKLGKEKFGTEFYVSDMLEDVIYKVNDGNVTELARDLRYPSSIAVDSIGNIFYTTTPLWIDSGFTGIDYPTELRMLNPKTLESTLIHKFDERNLDEYAGFTSGIYVKYQGKTYVLPVGFNVSNILYESENKMDFLFTNSHQGTLKVVSANKY